MSDESNNKLKTFNNVLSLLVATTAIYIILLPFLPNIIWWVNHQTPIRTHQIINVPLPAEDKKNERPKVNTIIIPALNLKQQIFDGQSEYTLNKGLWHLPATSNPKTGGNTVIAGHRFIYGSSSPFFHLDKLKVGDTITVYWQNERYDYEVNNVQVVPPTQVSILQNTKEPKLTLFTCTPLWTAKNRLVISAKLTEVVK